MLEIRWNMYAFTFQSPQDFISPPKKKNDPKNLTHTDAQKHNINTQTLFARFYNININNKHFIITHTV